MRVDAFTAPRTPTERILLWLAVLLALGAFGGAVGLITGLCSAQVGASPFSRVLTPA